MCKRTFIFLSTCTTMYSTCTLATIIQLSSVSSAKVNIDCDRRQDIILLNRLCTLQERIYVVSNMTIKQSALTIIQIDTLHVNNALYQQLCKIEN